MFPVGTPNSVDWLRAKHRVDFARAIGEAQLDEASAAQSSLAALDEIEGTRNHWYRLQGMKKNQNFEKNQKNPVYLKKTVFIRVFFKARFFSKFNTALLTNDLFKPYSTGVYYFEAF